MRFEKTVMDVTTGANPATQAQPGDTLRYTLRVENLSDVALNGFAVRDELDRLNATAAFVPGSLTVVSAPAGADTTATSATGGAKGTGLLDVRNLTLAPSGWRRDGRLRGAARSGDRERFGRRPTSRT
jgi:uncharacterized repeat protein (TIGR01451 family)